MSTAYIVLPSTAIGGIEKRLAGLFLHFVSKGEPVRLVASEELVGALAATPDAAAIVHHDKEVDAFPARTDAWNALKRELSRILKADPRGVFHYGLVSPLRLHRSRSKRTLYTIPNASLAQYNARGLVEVYGGVLRASHVDVLDPQVFAQLVARFPWRRGSFTLTPGSFVDLGVYAPAPVREKRNRIVFTGLFSDEKQAPRLIGCLPEVLRLLDAAGFADAEIFLLGRDPEGGNVSRAVAALGSPRVRAYFEADPKSVLRTSRVFLSLQRSTNHPSKALLEAMACGCVPVVTDTRDSRRSAPDHLAIYVPRDFDAADLARACIDALRMGPRELEARVAAMRSFLAERFSLAASAAYYRLLYEQLRALPAG